MIHFLIDYENRNEYGLTGIRLLSEYDNVYILFSQNACKLDLNVISDTASHIHAIKVQSGRQSLDMHLVSCLGFLLNQHGIEDDYYVISDDTDFDKVIEFWKNRGYKVSRIKSIEIAFNPEAADAAASVDESVRKKRSSSRRNSSRTKKTAASDKKEESRPEITSEGVNADERSAASSDTDKKASAAETKSAEVIYTVDAVSVADAASLADTASLDDAVSAADAAFLADAVSAAVSKSGSPKNKNTSKARTSGKTGSFDKKTASTKKTAVKSASLEEPSEGTASLNTADTEGAAFEAADNDAKAADSDAKVAGSDVKDSAADSAATEKTLPVKKNTEKIAGKDKLSAKKTASKKTAAKKTAAKKTAEAEASAKETVPESAEESVKNTAVLKEEPVSEKIKASASKKTAGGNTSYESKAKPDEDAAPKNTARKSKAQPDSVAINSHIQKFLAQNKINGAAINAIASIVAGNAGKKDKKALTYRQIIKKFGQKEGLEYYKMLKSEL